MTTAYRIEVSRFGDTTEFATLAEAQSTLRECGYDVQLEARAGHIYDGDEVVGSVEEQETPSPRERWEAATTPVFRVLDENGDNPENAQVRQLPDGTWLHSDDLDGVVEVDADDVARWELEPTT
jgi:hypothetical protein